MRSFVVATAVTALLAGAAFGSSSKLPAPVTLAGVSGVVPGLGRAAVERRWDTPLRFYKDPSSPGCDQADVRAGSTKGYTIFFKKKFDAIFFFAGARTAEGVHIGSTLAEVRKAYGSRLHTEKDKYLQGGLNQYLRGARYEIRIDTSAKGRVTQIAFGDGAVHLVEGCL